MTAKRKRAVARAAGLAAVMVAASLVAACGSSSSSSKSSSAGAGSSASAGGSSASAVAVAISTTKGPDGTYLTAGSGRAVYMWVGDSNGKSNCSGDCAIAWPPLITKGTPIPSGGVTAADLGTITRSDGSRQVTYAGHPLYYFESDSGSGTTKGQGSDSFGAKWWLVASSGAAITANGSSSVSPAGGY